MPESVQMLLVGSASLIVGALFIILRKPVARFYAEVLPAAFGRMGISAGRRSTPSMTAFTGAGFVFIGSVLVLVSLFR